MPRLTDRLIAALRPPAKGNTIIFDTDVLGFGLRVTAGEVKSFVLNYRLDGTQRRLTIGRWGIEGPWQAARARKEANGLKREIDLGRDPMLERHEARNAPTISELADKFLEEHVDPKLRPTTAAEYRRTINSKIKPAFGSRRAAALTRTELERWHRAIAQEAPYHANRALSVLSSMLTFAEVDNLCCKGVARAQEDKRRRYATSAEIKALMSALAQADDKAMGKAVLLLLLTGARRSEVLTAKWAQFDLQRGSWTKPASTTKQRKEHIVPLSSSAMAVLASLAKTGPELFPGTFESNRYRLHECFAKARTAAGCPDLHLHDLRHTFASLLASQPSASLPLIGAMLGHSTPSTTHRYTHLFDDPQRAAAERVGQFIEGVAAGKQAEVINLKK